MDEKDAVAAAEKVGRGEHPNQLKGDSSLIRAIESLPHPLPADLEEDRPNGDEPPE
jgi:hypothetical protein